MSASVARTELRGSDAEAAPGDEDPVVDAGHAAQAQGGLPAVANDGFGLVLFVGIAMRGEQGSFGSVSALFARSFRFQ